MNMKEEPMASSESSDSGSYERLGAKLLSLPDVIAQSIGFIGPVFSSAFVIPLVVGVISASGKGGGVASPLSVLIAAVGVGCAVSASRGIFAMARDRRIPGVLATVSRRQASPLGATVVLIGPS